MSISFRQMLNLVMLTRPLVKLVKVKLKAMSFKIMGLREARLVEYKVVQQIKY